MLIEIRKNAFPKDQFHHSHSEAVGSFRFEISSLTYDSDGLFSVFSRMDIEHPIVLTGPRTSTNKMFGYSLELTKQVNGVLF